MTDLEAMRELARKIGSEVHVAQSGMFFLQSPPGKKWVFNDLHVLSFREGHTQRVIQGVEAGAGDCLCLICQSRLCKALGLESGTPKSIILDAAKEAGLIEM